jgi:hypothetical protein
MSDPGQSLLRQTRAWPTFSMGAGELRIRRALSGAGDMVDLVTDGMCWRGPCFRGPEGRGRFGGGSAGIAEVDILEICVLRRKC